MLTIHINDNNYPNKMDLAGPKTFNYLNDQLKGEARQMLEGFASTGAHYASAVTFLQDTYGDQRKMAGFSFFDNKEPPKLPSTPGSSFGSLGNMPCFTFGAPKTTTASSDTKIFTFGFNSVKQTEDNFEIKMEDLCQSLSSITNQPLSVNLSKNKSISERAKRISSLENALAEIQSLKDKVSSMECNIAKLLMDELDSMKNTVSGCINPFNNMQIVEQKSVSTSPNQNFEYRPPASFPFGVSSNPITKPKTKLFANFKPQRENMPLVFNSLSVSVSDSTVPTSVSGSTVPTSVNGSTVSAPPSGNVFTDSVSVITNVAPITASTASAPFGSSATNAPTDGVTFTFGVVPTTPAVTSTDTELNI